LVLYLLNGAPQFLLVRGIRICLQVCLQLHKCLAILATLEVNVGERTTRLVAALFEGGTKFCFCLIALFHPQQRPAEVEPNHGGIVPDLCRAAEHRLGLLEFPQPHQNDAAVCEGFVRIRFDL
jgi:hypothetical protein